ncbi:transposase [Roseateles sp. BYS96W]|uniref:Transposase n=1 Tax=Pelomonas nitida TaxID=3299027 RepID=A0ABW7FZZ2_9BURK
MARPARLEIAGAVYLISAHCPRESRRLAFADEADRAEMLALLAQALHRFDAQALAYALLPRHYELLLFTRRANLSALMRHVNGVYTLHRQRRDGFSGSLFQGRFHAVLVDRERHLLDACRYVDLSPVREGATRGGAAAWPGSSFRALAGLEPAPEWLDVDGLHRFVLGRPALTAADHRRAGELYETLVASDPKLALWPGRLREQIFLGDADFAQRMRAAAARLPRPAARVGWPEWLRRADGIREQALWLAHTEGGVAMSALAGELGLSVSRVSRLIAAAERAV